MGKKVLLYIHSEQFLKEKKKSELVNNLLEQYYGHQTVPAIVYTNTDKRVHKNITNVYTPPPLNKDSKDYSLCTHGSVKGFCKKGCK